MRVFELIEANRIYAGDIRLNSIYLGDTKVWQEPSIDYEHQYFTTVAKGSGSIGIVIPTGISTSDFASISYSTDNRETWTTTNNVDDQTITVTVPVSNGDKVLWKGDGNTMVGQYVYCNFTSTVNYDVEGNIMSLLNGDNFYGSVLDTNYEGQFSDIFNNNTYLINASNLILPSNTTKGCYYGMFYNCTNLTTAPVLPATTLLNLCYSHMFGHCNSLNYIKMLATQRQNQSLFRWVEDVASSGTFVKDANMTALPTGADGIPDGWTVENE